MNLTNYSANKPQEKYFIQTQNYITLTQTDVTTTPLSRATFVLSNNN